MNRENDPSSALERLVSQFGALLRSAGHRRGLAAHEMDELIQEVRIRLWRALETGEKISAVNASYVYRAARFAAVDLVRRRRSAREVSLAPAGAGSGAEPVIASGPFDAAVRADVSRKLEQALNGLSEARRVPVRLYLSGYEREEIANLLGWTEPKVRNLLYRGLSDLREQLGALGVGPEGVT